MAQKDLKRTFILKSDDKLPAAYAAGFCQLKLSIGWAYVASFIALAARMDLAFDLIKWRNEVSGWFG